LHFLKKIIFPLRNGRNNSSLKSGKKKHHCPKIEAMVLIFYEENEALLATTAGCKASQGKQRKRSRGGLGDSEILNFVSS
jgi:hypothetical protein